MLLSDDTGDEVEFNMTSSSSDLSIDEPPRRWIRGRAEARPSESDPSYWL